MKILIIGGMHGNEPLGIEIAKRFQDRPIKGVDTILANEKAILNNSRFIEQDLNRSFPGNEDSNEYEIKRACFLLNLCKEYDLVLDFHNTYCPNNECTFIGKSADKSLFFVSSYLDL